MQTTDLTPSSAQVAPAKSEKGNPLRLGILLLILSICVVALGYDHYSAKPNSLAAHAKLEALNLRRNASAAQDSVRLTSEVIQKELGSSPTWVDKRPTCTIEYYCWWGKTPLISMRRHYKSLVFTGSEPRQLSAHYLNEIPPESDLPQADDVMAAAAALRLPSPEGGKAKPTAKAPSQEED